MNGHLSGLPLFNSRVSTWRSVLVTMFAMGTCAESLALNTETFHPEKCTSEMWSTSLWISSGKFTFTFKDVVSANRRAGTLESLQQARAITSLSCRRVKSIANQESLKERFQILHPTSLFRSFNIERMDGSRPFASGASKGRACLKHSPWAEHLCFRTGNKLLHSSPGYPQKTKRRLFDW